MHVHTGMILAAGLGTRLKPLTDIRPKPLAEVIGVPLIVYALYHMQAAKAKEVVINTHHLADKIPAFLGDSFLEMRLYYIHEPTILGTGGGVKNAERYFGKTNDPILLMNGDILLDLDMQKLLTQHVQRQPVATMVLKNVENPEKYGAIGTDSNERVMQVAHYLPYEGPLAHKRMFCGTHVLSPQMLSWFPKADNAYASPEIYAKIVHSDGFVLGFEQNGFYGDLGTPQDLLRVNLDILQGKLRLHYVNPFLRFEEKAKSVWLGKNVKIDPSAHIVAPVVLDDDVTVEKNAVIGPNVVIGKRSRIWQNAKLKNTVIFSDTTILQDADLQNTIVCEDAYVKVA